MAAPADQGARRSLATSCRSSPRTSRSTAPRCSTRCSRGLQLQPLWRVHAAAVSSHGAPLLGQCNSKEEAERILLGADHRLGNAPVIDFIRRYSLKTVASSRWCQVYLGDVWWRSGLHCHVFRDDNLAQIIVLKEAEVDEDDEKATMHDDHHAHSAALCMGYRVRRQRPCRVLTQRPRSARQVPLRAALRPCLPSLRPPAARAAKTRLFLSLAGRQVHMSTTELNNICKPFILPTYNTPSIVLIGLCLVSHGLQLQSLCIIPTAAVS